MAGRLPALFSRKHQKQYDIKDAAKLNGVKTKYMSMCTWRPGGKRRRQRHDNS